MGLAAFPEADLPMAIQSQLLSYQLVIMAAAWFLRG